MRDEETKKKKKKKRNNNNQPGKLTTISPSLYLCCPVGILLILMDRTSQERLLRSAARAIVVPRRVHYFVISCKV